MFLYICIVFFILLDTENCRPKLFSKYQLYSISNICGNRTEKKVVVNFVATVLVSVKKILEKTIE